AGESSTSTPAVTEFSDWWKTLTIALSAKKDVDGLHPKTMKLLKKNSWREQGRVMPATARAVIEILEIAKSALQHSSNQINSKSKHIIVGTSDIVGQPLFFELKNQGYPVEMIGRAELQLRIESGIFLTDAHVIISATGSKNLITGQMITSGTVVIDVGEPSPDVEFKTVAPKAAFITPVPGGVGPMTVVCLLENCLDLVK
ncbi:MAG: bifunctional 5,10-methylenetetrahydrofolate dehydrogenase/5,10-methenyltetrahydrofolate cyclohydrolase, partial [Microgenomates group bacterium]